MQNPIKFGLMLAASGLLAACSGGSDSPPPPVVETGVPASAQADIPGLLAYMKVQATTPNETGEPVDLSAVTLPTSDTAEPDPAI